MANKLCRILFAYFKRGMYACSNLRVLFDFSVDT